MTAHFPFSGLASTSMLLPSSSKSSGSGSISYATINTLFSLHAYEKYLHDIRHEIGQLSVQFDFFVVFFDLFFQCSLFVVQPVGFLSQNLYFSVKAFGPNHNFLHCGSEEFRIDVIFSQSLLQTRRGYCFLTHVTCTSVALTNTQSLFLASLKTKRSVAKFFSRWRNCTLLRTEKKEMGEVGTVLLTASTVMPYFLSATL